LPAFPDSSIRHRDVAAQQHVIEEGLKRFTGLLDSHLGFFPEDVQRMLRYVHDHLFEETLTVERLKADCGLKNHNVTTEFPLAVGIGTHEYIVNQRLKAAATILSKNEINIYLVASAIGYTEEAFSRLFRETYGCTPSQYREDQSRRKG
jgi:AraC-like DNA-binding protein